MAKRGTDISGQRITILTPDMITDQTDVIVFCDAHILPPYVKNGRLALGPFVEDPYNQSADFLEETADQIFNLVGIYILAYLNKLEGKFPYNLNHLYDDVIFPRL